MVRARAGVVAPRARVALKIGRRIRTRSTIVLDMLEEERPEPPYGGDERATLIGFLEFQRATLGWKCDGLSDEQLRQRSISTSAMSLLGLVRHLADVEQNWFRASDCGCRRPLPGVMGSSRRL